MPLRRQCATQPHDALSMSVFLEVEKFSKKGVLWEGGVALCCSEGISPGRGPQLSAGYKIQVSLSTPPGILHAWVVVMWWPQGGHTYCKAALVPPTIPGPCTCCRPWEPGCPRAHPHFLRPLDFLQSPLCPLLGSTPPSLSRSSFCCLMSPHDRCNVFILSGSFPPWWGGGGRIELLGHPQHLEHPVSHA